MVLHLFALLIMAVGYLSDTPEASELEAQVLAHRRLVNQAELVLHQKSYDGENAVPGRTRTTSIWMDGDRIRCDILLRPEVGTEEERHITCKNCQLQKHFLTYTEIKSDDGRIPIIFEPLDAKIDPSRAQILNPRLLGMDPDLSPNLVTSNLEKMIGRPDRSKPGLHKDTWNGIACWRMEYRLHSGPDVRVWILPNHGPSVAKIEVAWGSRGSEIVDSVESDLEKHEPDVWFPKKITYTRLVNGKRSGHDSKETVDVEVKSLNKNLSPEVFTLRGINPRPGTPITGIVDVNRGLLLWDGKEIISQSGNRLPPEIALSNQIGRDRTWLFWSAVGSGVVAVALISGYLYRRRPGGLRS